MSDEKWRAGRVSIHRTSGGTGGDTFSIELVDQASRTQCVEIELSPLVMIDALSGRARQTCSFRFRPEKVGLRHEYKTEVIPLADYPSRGDPEMAAAILAPYEVDGWTARRGDVTNHHNLSCVRDRWSVMVHFSRWVEPEPGWEPEP